MPDSPTRSVREEVTDQEWALRQDLAAAYRLVALYGWDELIFTHLSLRLPGDEHQFLINPLGLLFEEITASNLVKIDLQGKKVMPSPHMINPAGFVIHGAIHEARDDAQAVMHIHTIAGTGVSAQKDGLLPLSQNALLQWGDVSYHDYEGLAVEDGEKERLVADMGSKPCLILRNHGLLTVGPTVGDAFLRLFSLQRACEMQIAAQAGGGELVHQSDAMGQKVNAQAKHSFAAGAHLSWAALRRKLDRLQPDYKH